MNWQALTEQCLEFMQQAAFAIEECKSDDLAIQKKQDESPVTKADLASESIILQGLADLARQGFDYPCLSEESAQNFQGITNLFWCVDPLDGTKDFIHQTGDYTINLALFEGAYPVIGIIAVPQIQTFYFSYPEGGAWMRSKGTQSPIHCRPADRQHIHTLISRFHNDSNLLNKLKDSDTLVPHQVGSALKFCKLADGSADFYPRLGPTSLWDIAAGHSILKAAGGELFTLNGQKFKYSFKSPWRMPQFYAVGDPNQSWNEIIHELI